MKTNFQSCLNFALLSLFILVLFMPVLGILNGVALSDIGTAFMHEYFLDALWLSTKTSLLSLTAIILIGTPVSWLLAQTNNSTMLKLKTLFELPVIMPPAVVGLGLLLFFSPTTPIGARLSQWGLVLPFSEAAVVLSQTIVALPFYLVAASSVFSTIEQDLLITYRTLGLTRQQTFRRVILPLCLPNLVDGAALAWARALGEFGATLLFAGSLAGKTMTLPIAIYQTLEANVSLAIALAITLIGAALLLISGLRLLFKRKGSLVSPMKRAKAIQ